VVPELPFAAQVGVLLAEPGFDSMSALLARANGARVESGKEQFGNHMLLISVIIGPVLYDVLGPCLGVVTEKRNVEMPFGRSPMSFFE
jgi:hypothetical protein